MTITLLVFAATAIAQGTQGPNADGQDGDQGREKYAIGLWGDLPYSDVQALNGIPNLIADMNHRNSHSQSTMAI